MSLTENNAANGPDESNDDGLDQTTPNDNQELDRINDAVQAAEPSFTLNYGTAKTDSKEKDEDLEEGRNIKQ